MEGSPRKSTSLNFGLPDLFLGSSYPPTFNLVPNSKIYSTKDTELLKFSLPRNYHPKMSHSVSVDDTINSISDTKKNFVQSMTGMFGSLKNIVSKIPNFMSNINNSLSVTVVPNEGIMSPEDIVKNLTRSAENLTLNDKPLGVFEKIDKCQINCSSSNNQTSNNYDPSTHIMDLFATKILPSTSAYKKFKNIDDYIVKPWKEDLYCSEHNLKPRFMSSVNQNNCNDPLPAVQSDQSCSYKNNNPNTGKQFKSSDKITSSSNDNLVDSQDGQNSEFIEDLILIEKVSISDSSLSDPKNYPKQSCEPKPSLTQYTSIKCEFRSRKSSESSTNSDDSCFIIFENGSQSDINYDCASLSDFDTDDEKPKFDESKHFMRQSMSIKCDFRSRQTSESSIDSENSCFIVFNDEHECDDISCKLSSDEESDDDKKTGQRVRFNLKPAIHTMIKWNFAYRAARKGPWEEIARDRDRFRNKINSIGQILNPILTNEHRDSIWQNRFAVQD